MHKSYDRLAKEHIIDKFNIDYLRYFNKKNLIGNWIGAIIGCIIFFEFNIYNYFAERISSLVGIYLMGCIGVFILFMVIAYHAGNSHIDSAAIAGKRGLFSFVFLTFIVLVAIIITGSISLEDTFGKFFYMVLSGQIVAAVFAVPLDLAATFSKKD